MERTRPPPQLTADETQQVLKRAAQLERPDPQASEPSLDFAEVERIGLEAGLSREAIQRAFVELRSGALRPPAEPRLIDKLIGPEQVASERASDLPPELLRKRLHEIMKADLLHPEERVGSRTTWSPTPGLWAAIQRGVNWQGQSSWGKGTITSEVTQAPPGTQALSVARLEAKPGGRVGYLLSGMAPGLSMVPVAVASSFSPHHPVALPLTIGAFSIAMSAFGMTMTRLQYRKRMRALKLAIERVLEKLGGEPDEQ